MLNLSINNLKKILFPVKGNAVIVTLGNTLRADDSAGPYIYSELCSCKKIKIINAKENPENIIDDVIKAKPAKIIIIDAADFNGYPGEIKILNSDNLPEISISTHTFPVSVIAKIIEKDTGVKINYIGIQVKDITLGKKMCPEVKKSADKIINIIKGDFKNA